jgi:AraC-like DNA-binding protein
MRHESPERPALHPTYGLAVLADLLRELGVDPVPLLEAEGVDPLRLRDSQARVEPAVELAVIRRAIAAAGIPGLGLRAGQRHHFGLFGTWGLALASSPDLAGAIRVGLRYIGLVHTFLSWRFVEDESLPRLEASEVRPLGPLRRFVMERDMAAAVTLLGDFTGDRRALSGASFPYPAPAWADAYHDVFGPAVVFGAPRAVLRINPDRLRRPLPQANPMTARLAEEQCRLLLSGRSAPASAAERLRRALLARPGVFPALPDAAAACGLSVRTLRRHLAAEGTSYRDELDRIRRELATRYLADTGLSLTETADRLGYRDAAAFSHAFRRWFGESPGRWRRRQRT